MKKTLLLLLCVSLLSAVALGQLSGTKTIGPSGDYTTLKAAFDALNTSGVASGGVTFQIQSGTYNEDTLVIRTTTSSVSAPIFIKPASGATVVINGTPPAQYINRAAIKIDSTKYVTIDGSNSGTTSRNLTINAVGDFGFNGIFITKGSTNATVKNCYIRSGWRAAVDSIGFRTINITGGTNCHNALIENNILRNAARGIYAAGYSAGDSLLGVIIRNNLIDSVSTAGIHALTTTGIQIYNNDVSVLVSQSTSTADNIGIYVGSLTDRARIFNNKVHDITNNGSGQTYGIYQNASTTGVHAGSTCYNNFVWNLLPGASNTNTIYGMAFSTGNPSLADTIVFNTVNMYGTFAGDRKSAAFFKSQAAGAIVVRNNIFQNTRIEGTVGTSVAIGKTSTATVMTDCDYNNLWVGTLDAQHSIGRTATTTPVYRSTLADWQTINTSDAHSISESVPFVSATDLHVSLAVSSGIKNAGTPVPGFTTDIDGQSRHATAPDIGADECKVAVAVRGEAGTMPQKFTLAQNYPNPFNPETQIQFTVSQRASVRLALFDVLGREVMTLVNEELNSGNYSTALSAARLSSGMYFYRLEASVQGQQIFQSTRKLLLVR